MTNYSRRNFLKVTGSAGVGLTLLSHPLTLLSNGSPSSKIVVAVMGVRSRGRALAVNFARQKDTEVAYVCDVDERYLNECIKSISAIQQKRPKGEKDFRKILDDKSVDALVIAAPDHWHAPATIMACEAGKHVYVEKPCSHNPKEGEMMVKAALKYKRKVQMGAQRRSWPVIIEGIEEVRKGTIGNAYFAKGWYANTRPSIGTGKVDDVPDYLDFNLWQGPAPRKEYRDNIHPYNWHWFWHWGTGEAGNNGTHSIDLMRWGLGVDYPVKVVSAGGRYHFRDDWETPDTQVMSFEFEENKVMTWEGRSCNGYGVEGSGYGIIFYGDQGTLVMGNNSYAIYDMEKKLIRKKEDVAENDPQNILGPGERLDALHINNFLNSIRRGDPLNLDIKTGHISTLLCHLGNIAQRTDHALHTDPLNGHILQDEAAMKLWSRTYEPGWKPDI